MTDAERKLWWHLRQLPMEGSHFRRQATIGPYFVDFACHEKKLVVEVDGSQHGEPDRSAKDSQRTAFLNANGYRVVRFWNNEVLKETRSVMEAIYAALYEPASQQEPPTPDPSPPCKSAGGGESRLTASDTQGEGQSAAKLASDRRSGESHS
jgi:very-short-patch-repair endonuclease